MKFRDVLDSDHLLLVACHDCGGKTPRMIALMTHWFGSAANVPPEKCCRHCCR